jgi:thioredoxin-dependent peroxiredoxin
MIFHCFLCWVRRGIPSFNGSNARVGSGRGRSTTLRYPVGVALVVGDEHSKRGSPAHSINSHLRTDTLISMRVEVGDEAPDFTLAGTGGTEYTLSSYRGHYVVLAFYPGDNSPVCTMQLNSYANDHQEFEGLDAQVIGLSPQDVASHEKFNERQGGFGFPLLADKDKTVGKLYGVLGPLGFYRRSVFVVNPDGKVTYAHRSATGVTFKKTDEILNAIRG